MNNEEKIEKAVEDFGTTVHEFRVRNSLTLQDLAELVSCSPAYLWRIENHRRNPSVDFRLRFLEQGMGLSTAEIYVYLEKYIAKEKLNRESE